MKGKEYFILWSFKKSHNSQVVGSGSSFQNNITNNFLKYRAWDCLAYIQLHVTEGIYRVLTNMNCVMSRLFALFRLYDKLNLTCFHAIAYSCRKTVILGTLKRISKVII